MTWEIREGDCVEAMAAMSEASVDAIVCDPPYGLEFMGKEWDRLGDGFRRAANPADVSRDNPFGRASRTSPEYRAGCAMHDWHEAWARQALRVLKPGGHLLAFGGTRTYHRMVCAIEDAGFEIRDTICWLYGSGFPKSLNLEGEREGWGTALKPAHEPVVLARKTLIGTVVANVEAHGTGALNIDGCRIDGAVPSVPQPDFGSVGGRATHLDANARNGEMSEASGRWPANVVLDEEAANMLDEQSGELHSQDPLTRNSGRKPGWSPSGTDRPMLDKANPNGADRGGASRFFYCAKASSAERNAGLAHLPLAGRTDDGYGTIQTPKLDRATPRENWTPHEVRNLHPTVKPVELMRWLVRLVTPPGGSVLDPFAGSGTTGIAALREGFSFIGIEREPEYVEIARARIRGDAPLLNTPTEVAA